MRVLVLGGAGMLGHRVVERLQRGDLDVMWTLRGTTDDRLLEPAPWLTGAGAIAGFDAEDERAMARLLDEVRPEVVVNCLGVIKQRPEAERPIPSLLINSLLPHRIAAQLEIWGGRVVHFSTDCVFNGRRGSYSEGDVSDAEDLYGRTKFLGEVAEPNALTLRTSIIGRELRHHNSLLDWFLSQRGRTIKGFCRHWWSGVTTNHMADIVHELLVNHPGLSGLHQVSTGRISKYDLLVMLRDGLRFDVDIVPDDGPLCDRSLLGDKFRQATGYSPPSWPDLIAQLAEDPTRYPRLPIT